MDDDKEEASGMDVSTTTELQDSQTMVKDLSRSSDQYWFPLNIDGSSPGKTEDAQGPNSSTGDDGSAMTNWKNQSEKRNWLGSDSQEDRRLSTQRASIRSSGVPTTASGEIEFSGLNQTAKFVHLPDSTPEEKLRELITHKWDLRRPTLIISIFGGNDFEKKRKLKVILKKGLFKAAESGCWVITGGFNVGIYKLAGEAVRDYTDAYGGDNMIAFGVNSWGCVARNEVLDTSNYDGTNPIIYQIEADLQDPDEEGEDPEVKQNTSEEEKPLDPNHTHFLLVDTGVAKLKGEEAKFRAKFESVISVWHDEEGEVTVPMCGLVVGGDRFTLKQIYFGLINNGCPFVITRGTGGASDGLAEAININNNLEIEDEEEGDEDILGNKIEAALYAALCEIHPDVENFREEVEMIKEILESKSHLVSIFDMEEDFDLDGFLISSLLSSASTNVVADQLNMDQLKITLTLNRPDIARDKIFLDNKKYKKGDLNDYMYQALMNDRCEFVKLFLEQGFSLEEFLTVYTLEKLYTDQLKRLNSKVAIFHQLWEYHRSHRNSKKVSLREVGKVIRVLVGDFYHPLYLYKEFQKKLVDQKMPQSVTLKAMLQSTQTTLAPAYHLCKTASPQGSVSNSVVACTAVDTTSLATEPKLFSEIQFIDDDDTDSSPLQGSPSAQGIDNEITIESESALNIGGERTKSQEIIGIYPLDGKRRPRRKSSLDFVNSLNNTALTAPAQNHEQPGSSWLMSNIGEKALDPDLDDRAKYVQLDRPARELMLWSILVGKLQMSELFWTMEKEPIAAALLASMLLSSLESKTDDFTDKEDFLNYARHFEEQAEGVLDECYRENEHRAQHLIDRELYYYGTSSVILLSAEGESIRFMAHPCCQDFLNNTWMGKLSPKNSMLRIGVGAICGLCFPFFIPKIVLFKKVEPTKAEKTEAADNAAVEMNELSGGDVQFYPGQEKQGQKSRVERSDKLNFRQYVERIRDFYMSPIMRFLYNTISYLVFLFIFCYFLMFNFLIKITMVEGVVIGWIATLLLEEVKQATLSGISFSTYISDGWNKLDCAAVGLFVAGFILRLISATEYFKIHGYEENEFESRYVILNDNKFIVARIFLAVSLFLFIVRVMYIFSFHMALGPKLIMIWKMVVNDLVPFMVILIVFVVGYGVMSHVIAYPNNLYTPLSKDSKTIQKINDTLVLTKLLSRPYFQMFGDFSLDDIRGDTTSCTADGLCPNRTSRWLVPIILGIYVLLTNILMFNLLIAMFSQTYETIEKSSTHYWNYQRYQMISEYVDRSPLAPPLIVVWHVYELFRYIRINCFKKYDDDDEYNPFCKSYKSNRKKERELQKWEHLKAMDFLRNQNEPQGKRGTKTAGRSDGRTIVARHTQGAGGVMQPGDMKKEFSDVTEQLNMELDKKFRDIEAQFQRFTDLEQRIQDLGVSVSGVSNLISDVGKAQDKINLRINQLPLCQCAEMMEGGDEPEPPPSVASESVQQAAPVERELTEEEKRAAEEAKSTKKKKKLNQLEEAIRRVVESVYQEQPSWVEEATRNAAQSVLDNIQIPAPPPPVPIAPSPSTTSVHSLGTEKIVVEPPPAPPSPSPPPSVNEEEEWAASVAVDEVFAPEVPTPSTGRVIERQCSDHRLYRLAPFNFEKYAGMRMNVPPEKTPWPIDYPDYYAYDASDEILEYTKSASFDNDDIDVRSISFNQYDVKHSVRRQSLLGRYRIDTRSGLPLNPMGRSGLRGRGLLPRWGPNHAIILILTRWHRDDEGKPVQRNGRPILQYVALVRNKQQCIPWFLTDHQARCDVDSCVLKASNSFMQSRLRSVCEVKFAFKNFKSLDNAEVEKVYKGYLDDHLNADNAWIEAVVLNYHESADHQFTDDLLKIFTESNVEEQVRWLEVAYSTALRSSHSDMLKTVSQMHKAYF